MLTFVVESVSGHMALRDATAESGEQPVQGVTFPQPGCIPNDTAAAQQSCSFLLNKVLLKFT